MGTSRRRSLSTPPAQTPPGSPLTLACRLTAFAYSRDGCLDTAPLPNAAGEILRPIQQIERRKMPGAAVEAIPSLAAAEHHADIVTGWRLTDLHIDQAGMEYDLTGTSHAPSMPVKPVRSGRQVQSVSETDKLPAGGLVKRALRRPAIGGWFLKIERG